MKTVRGTAPPFTHPARLHRAWLMLAVCLLAASMARAQPTLLFEFQGVVTELTGNTGIFGFPGTVQVNDPFTGRFSYEIGPGNPDQEPADPKFGRYDLTSFEIDQAVVTITPFALLVRHEPGLITLPPAPPDPGTDGFSVTGTYPAGDMTRGVSLGLEANFGTVFTDDSLPLDLSLDDFPVRHDVRAIVVLGLDGNPSQIDVGQLTSLILVPEPASASCLVGLGIILSVRPRRLRRMAGG